MNLRQLRIADHLYFTGLLMLVAGLPVSLFLTSLSQFFLIGSFLFGGNYREKFQRFFSNKAAVLIAGIWLLHLIGLMWTAEMNEGIKDLRIKLPLLLLPIIIAGNKPVSPTKLKWILLVFVGAVFSGTVVSMAVLVGIIQRNIYDIRDVFIFNISHIRFALFTCLSVFILLYYLFFDKKNVPSVIIRVSGLLMLIWLLSFLIIVVSVTGLVVLAITGLILLFANWINKSGRKTKIILLLFLIAIPILSIYGFKKLVSSYNKDRFYTVVTEKTKLGNDYDIPPADTVFENGYPIWMYVNEMELRQTWNNLSTFKYDSTDERGQPMRMTLIRFLTSKGFRKDAEAIGKLNVDERHSIERGIANVNYQKVSSISARLHQILWEVDQFMRYGSASGHSVTQRLEFWRAATRIVSANFYTGVGTGDMPTAYYREYKLMNSKLDKSHQLRAHNQFLAIFVAFGIFGFIYFLIAIFYSVFSSRFKMDMLFAAFFMISFLSMLSEDTLETQAGVTFFSFFFILLLRLKNNYETIVVNTHK